MLVNESQKINKNKININRLTPTFIYFLLSVASSVVAFYFSQVLLYMYTVTIDGTGVLG